MTSNQKRIEIQKLNALIGFCEASECRRQILLNYFGENSKPCGNCDNCLKPPQIYDGTIAAQKALSTVYRTEQRFGVAYLIDVLLGAQNSRIKNFNHHNLSVYGIGKEFSKQEWQTIFRQLIAMNFLQTDMAGHGGLSITNDGHKFLREKLRINLRKITKTQKLQNKENNSKNTIIAEKNKKYSKTESIKTKKSEQNTKTSILNPESEAESALFAKLKAKRLEIAKSLKIPPFMIFHDKTLLEIAKQKPKNLQEMLKISGVGENKLKNYGEDFLRQI